MTATPVHALRVLAAALVLAVAVPLSAAAAERLSPAEVKEIFVDTPWHSDSGAFLFRESGTYSYYDFSEQEEWGPWAYKMDERGGLVGESTTYKFFRRDNGSFYYFHTRSGEYYNAYPGKSFP